MQLSVTIERKLAKPLFEVLACIGFWNTEGQQTYALNRQRKLGSKTSQDLAMSLPFDEWMLHMICSDISVFYEGFQKHGEEKYWVKGYIYGKGGSHVWVSNEKNERVLFIYINK